MGDIARDPTEQTGFLKPTPEMYVEAAMGKCRSGVHYGYLSHEIVGVIIENILDIVPLDIPQKLFTAIYKRRAAKEKKK